MRYIASWRPLLRLAWRDARRARGRSILVLVMIALPVLGVVAADVLIATQDVSGSEALERRLGAADARIQFTSRKVVQGFDPDDQSATTGRARRDDASLAAVSEVLGRDVTGIELTRSSSRVVTDQGVADVETTTLDLRDPLAEGIWRVDSGRAPGAQDEVVVNTALAERGFVLGDSLEVPGGETYTVVGIGESTSYRSYPALLGLDPALSAEEMGDGSRTFLVDAGDVTWSEVRDLNAIGASVLSRVVMLDPPPDSEIPAEIQEWNAGTDDALLAVAILIVVMALMEVVLLAGPAFAVSARRQSRNLALMAATGGTPAQSRRVILASGVVLGGIAAVFGVGLGLLLAWGLMPVLQRFSGSWLGPYDVPWLHVAGIAAFGLASAVIAAVVPAWIASRQDVVAVLAGRRADRPAGMRSPLLGLALLGAGIAGAVAGAVNGSGGEILIAASAIPSVLGMILLVPVVLVVLAKLSGRLPLVLRYAVRDAARHRTRTVPAVAAVAATVAGVVALGVANASDAAQSEAMYTPMLPMGQASAQVWDADPEVFDRVRAVVASEVPAAAITDLRGIPESNPNPDGRWRIIEFSRAEGEIPLMGWTSTLGSSVLTSDGELPPLPIDLDDTERAAAERMLASGGAVLFTSVEVPDGDVRLAIREYGPRGGRGKLVGEATLPATYLVVDGDTAPGQAVVSAAAVEAAGIETAPLAMLVTGGVDERQEQDATEAIAAVTENASFYVERGWTNDDETVILLLVLGGLGALLMLGGTLTATFLALADARPDLATLSAVGASPRSRRGVAASYAVVVGLVGAVLGAAVGFIPGIAVTYPLTGENWGSCVMDASGMCVGESAAPSHYLDVPWLLIGTIVLVLPLVTALVVGLFARSRLPLVARLG